MTAIDDLRSAVDDVKTAAQAEHDELAQVANDLGTVEGQLTQLQTQAAQGGGVSEADIAAVTESVTAVAQGAKDAVAAAKSNPAVAQVEGNAAPDPTAGVTGTVDPAGGAAPDPSAGGTTDPSAGGAAPVATDPSAGGVATDPTATDPSAGGVVDPGTGAPVSDPAAPVADPAAPVADPGAGPTDPTGTSTPADPAGGAAPAGGVTDPTATAPTGVSVNERAVYTFSGDPATIDPTTWPAAPVQTEDSPPKQLYYFAGDSEPGEQNGAGVAGWEVYSGSTQPTVAATSASVGEAAAPSADEAPEG